MKIVRFTINELVTSMYEIKLEDDELDDFKKAIERKDANKLFSYEAEIVTTEYIDYYRDSINEF